MRSFLAVTGWQGIQARWVATVFAGVPHGVTGLTSWDAASGFSDARQAVTAREDSAALARLGGAGRHAGATAAHDRVFPRVARNRLVNRCMQCLVKSAPQRVDFGGKAVLKRRYDGQ